MDGATLGDILATGRFGPEWTGHMAALVDEAPVEMLARAVDAFPAGQRPRVLAHLRALARAVGSTGRIERWMTG